MYNPSQPRPSEYALKSGGYTPPEGDADIPCDPFATDVYILGTMIRTSFLDGDSDSYKPGVHGFEFLRPLVNDMIADDPSNRPTMTEVSSRFSDLVRKLSCLSSLLDSFDDATSKARHSITEVSSLMFPMFYSFSSNLFGVYPAFHGFLEIKGPGRD
ncbi:other 1 protein kinase [Lentinula edodes]|uniref:Other 1 protein kinase n=1 Tax=Lentinula edodes TaxID=5353 RepID=A0A1Q3EIP0_LENED|nr:other 1 protein kinase [Lentinula edodes]